MINRTSDSSSTVYLVDGAGHCADFYAATITEPYSVSLARKITSQKVKQWLKNTKSSMDLKETTLYKETEKVEKILEIKNWNAKIVSQKPVEHSKILLNLNQTKFTKKEKRMYGEYMDDLFGKRLPQQMERNVLDNVSKLEYLKEEYRFLSNPHYQRNASGPRFLILGGESPIYWQYVDDNYQFVTWAKDFDAAVYALEHRYFGQSYPIIDSRDDYLHYLNVEQAMADIAVFINAINARDNIDNPRWYIFGGSYAGNLAALFRLRYPNLSVGAVASSAPLQPKTDFFGRFVKLIIIFLEYMQKVESDIRSYAREGCPGAIRRYFAWYRKKMLTRDGRKQVVIINKLCNDWNENYIDEKDAELLLVRLVTRLGNILLYDNENHDWLNDVCVDYKEFDDTYGADKLVVAQKIHSKLENLHQKIHFKHTLKSVDHHAVGRQNRLIGQKLNADSDSDDDSNSERSSDSGSGSDEQYECWYYISYNQLLASLQTIHYNKNSRMWLWMTCNEWGFAQSTNYGKNIFEICSHLIELCIDVFGEKYDRESMHAGVLNTLKKYGGQENYNGTNVVLVNGSEDPWSTLGVTAPLQPSATAITIDGTSHCEDMYREKKNDVKVLKAARKQIKQILEKWIN